MAASIKSLALSEGVATTGGQWLAPAVVQARCDYKLISVENLAVGELHALLAQLRREGWAIEHLLVDDDDQIAGINDLLELGVLLKRERSA